MLSWLRSATTTDSGRSAHGDALSAAKVPSPRPSNTEPLLESSVGGHQVRDAIVVDIGHDYGLG